MKSLVCHCSKSARNDKRIRSTLSLIPSGLTEEVKLFEKLTVYHLNKSNFCLKFMLHPSKGWYRACAPQEL